MMNEDLDTALATGTRLLPETVEELYWDMPKRYYDDFPAFKNDPELEALRRFILEQDLGFTDESLREFLAPRSIDLGMVVAVIHPERIIRLDLPVWYQFRIESTDGGDPTTVLTTAVNELFTMIEALVSRTKTGLQKALFEMTALLWEEADDTSRLAYRDGLEKKFRLRLPKGRKRKSKSVDLEETRKVQETHTRLLKILEPAFKQRTVRRWDALESAYEFLGMPYNEDLHDELMYMRKANAAAVRLISESFFMSETSVRDRLSRSGSSD